jgi:hypothetical protein
MMNPGDRRFLAGAGEIGCNPDLIEVRACNTISDPIGTHHESHPKRSAGGFHAAVLTMHAT